MSLFLNNVRRMMNGDIQALSEATKKPVESFIDMTISEMCLGNLAECQRVLSESLEENIRINDYILETVFKAEEASEIEAVKIHTDLEVFVENVFKNAWLALKKLWRAFLDFLKKVVKKIAFTFSKMRGDGCKLVEKYGADITDVSGLKVSFYKYTNFEQWITTIDSKLESTLDELGTKYKDATLAFKDDIRLNLVSDGIDKTKGKLEEHISKMEKIKTELSAKPTKGNGAGRTLGDYVNKLITNKVVVSGSVEDISSQLKFIARGRMTSPTSMDMTTIGIENIKEMVCKQGNYNSADVAESLSNLPGSVDDFTNTEIDKITAVLNLKNTFDTSEENNNAIFETYKEKILSFNQTIIEAIKADSSLLISACNIVMNTITSLITERHRLAVTAFSTAYKHNLSKKKPVNETYDGLSLNESIFMQVADDTPLELLVSIL